MLNEQENLTIIEATIKDLKISENEIKGIVLENNEVYSSKSVVWSCPSGEFI